MVKNLKYKSTIKSRPFLFLETKKVSILVTQGFKEFEIKEKALVENIFQVDTEARKREIASTIINRINVLDHYLIEFISKGPLEAAKLVVLYSIMKTDRLFFEFMNEVYYEKLLLKETQLTDKDFHFFFQSKMEQDETVASWNDYTFYKLKQVYIRVLYEAGLLKDKKVRELIQPLMNYDLMEHFMGKDDRIYLNILMGEKSQNE